MPSDAWLGKPEASIVADSFACHLGVGRCLSLPAVTRRLPVSAPAVDVATSRPGYRHRLAGGAVTSHGMPGEIARAWAFAAGSVGRHRPKARRWGRGAGAGRNDGRAIAVQAMADRRRIGPRSRAYCSAGGYRESTDVGPQPALH